MPHTQLSSWLHHKPGNLSMVACQTVIFSGVNCSRRNPAETGTCWGFARGSAHLLVPVQGSQLVPLSHPHCWSSSEGPVCPVLNPRSFRVVKEQRSSWALNVLLPNSSDFCWLLQNWLWACWLLVQITAAAQENNLKSPGSFGKNANSNYSLQNAQSCCDGESFVRFSISAWKETTWENTEELSAAQNNPMQLPPVEEYPTAVLSQSSLEVWIWDVRNTTLNRTSDPCRLSLL